MLYFRNLSLFPATREKESNVELKNHSVNKHMGFAQGEITSSQHGLTECEIWSWQTLAKQTSSDFNCKSRLLLR